MKDLEKQIEEAADVLAENISSTFGGEIYGDDYGSIVESFISGAKSKAAKEYWQKGLYSETEVKELFDNYRVFRNNNSDLSIYDSENWFNENKKIL